MKQLLFFLFVLIALGSCRFTTGSGKIINEKRTVDNFDGISVAGGFEVEVKIGSPVSVEVEADDNIMKYIKTRTSGSTLKIETEDMHNFSDVHMKIYITTPSLKMINASASAEVTVQNVITSTDKLSFRASSGADIKAAVDAPNVETDVSSGASIDLKGKTKSYTAEASSGSDIRSWDLLSETATVNVSSGATAKVHASISLNATASSGAHITYHGAASLNKSVSSGGEVRKQD